MPEQDQSPLCAAIAEIAAKIKRYRGRIIGEQNTKASLIEPLLEALGWDIRDFDEVHREFKAKPADKPVDYALKMLRRPRLFIEAKGLGENLGDRKWISQVVSYAAVAGVSWCVLTDGDAYRFYNAVAPVDAEEKLFVQVRLSESDPAEVCRTFGLISRSNLEGDLLDAYWKAHFVDRRVIGVLRRQLTSAESGLVRLIRRELPELTPKQIADSILRLDVHIEPPRAWDGRPQPTVEPPTPAPEPPQPRTGAVAKPAKLRVKKAKNRSETRQDFKVTLRQLIEAGSLATPLPLFRKYKGQLMQATLHSDGTDEFQGERFPSCSTAAEKARSTVTGRQMNTNGWSFWQYRDGDEKPRELFAARADYLAARPEDSDPR